VRELGDDAGTDGTDSNSRTAFNDEEPLPACDTVLAVELEDGCRKETSKGVSDLLCNVQTG
jgi:hypothetical protein